MPQSNTSMEALQAARTPDVSVVIVSWNVAPLLACCLKALSEEQDRSDLNIEVLVIDNASTDDSVAVAQQFGIAEVVINDENVGYGKANNQGFRMARADLLLVLNPDAMPLPGAIDSLVQFAKAHPLAGITSPRLLNPDGTVQRAAFHFPTLLMAILDLFKLPEIVPGRVRAWLLNSRLNGRYPGEPYARSPFQIDHPLGACMLLRREALATCGGFDPKLFMYSEEVDLAMRWRKHGWQCWQVPAARVIHLGGQSTQQAPSHMFIELWRSRLSVYAKHYTTLAQLGLRSLLITSQLLTLGATFLQRALGRLNVRQVRQRTSRAVAVIKLALRRSDWTRTRS